jgi:hypothetical protein
LIWDLTYRKEREKGELTGERDSGEGAQVVDGEGVPVVQEVDGGVYEMLGSLGMPCV